MRDVLHLHVTDQSEAVLVAVTLHLKEDDVTVRLQHRVDPAGVVVESAHGVVMQNYNLKTNT